MNGHYTWQVITPDGRIVFNETGGREAEARANGAAERFNRLLPRGAKQAKVRMFPS